MGGWGGRRKNNYMNYIDEETQKRIIKGANYFLSLRPSDLVVGTGIFKPTVYYQWKKFLELIADSYVEQVKEEIEKELPGQLEIPQEAYEKV